MHLPPVTLSLYSCMLSVCPHPSLLCRSLSSHFWAFRLLHFVHSSPPIHSAHRFTLCLGSQSIACHFLSLVISLVHLRFASLFPYYSLSFFLYFLSFFWSPDALYMVLSHTLSLCPAYVLLDLTSHGTDYIFSPLSFIACFSWLVAFCFLPVFYSGGFLYKFHPLLFYVHTGFFHRGCCFATPIWFAITFSF